MASKPLLQKLADNPAFIEVRQSLSELNDALFKIQTRKSEIEMILASKQPAPSNEPSVHDAMNYAATGKLQVPTVFSGDLLDELATLRVHERSLRQAIERQTARAQQVEGEHRACVVKELSPAHKALMRRYLDALIALDAIVEEEAAMFRQVEATGVEARFNETAYSRLMGRVNDNSGSHLFYRVRDIKAYIGPQ
ncbi:hypothetical protein [Sphaerotilus mobilis]|uniref:Uncharacterized protein n=1 Tax=Sphaerotilus mobilis TaxID=47994 RepID=A0A4Q7LBH2_9BURK|nr:hypothetical protein [Sphaerotilus mobilis]RZS47495.1 hypothetical protein EV685_3700 [Sphaerotilus mobilis]